MQMGTRIMNGRQDEPLAAATRWVAAENNGDTAALEGLLAEDFCGVGPLGFVLSRAEWMDRHASGALRYTELRLEEPRVREHGGHAVVVARQVGEGTYRGHPVPAVLRASVVLRRGPEGWSVGHVHTSFVAGSPGAPPIPGRG